MDEAEVKRLQTPVTAIEMAQLVDAIPSGGETGDLRLIARRMAIELDRRRAAERWLDKEITKESGLAKHGGVTRLSVLREVERQMRYAQG